MASSKADYPPAAVLVTAVAVDVTNVAVAHATGPAGIPQRAPVAPERLQALSAMGVPPGLVEQFALAAENVARRYWIVDNSGSMNTFDGQKLVASPKHRGGLVPVQCSRWEELGATLEWHGRAAAALGAWTEFRLLNPASGTAQVVVVGGGQHEEEEATPLLDLGRLVRSRPASTTPLCAALHAVASELAAVADDLRAAGRSATVVVASDGAASDGDVRTALAPLAALPCHVVVRLCTDDDAVVAYWGGVDADLELDLDVLDDVAGEGREVHKVNAWLAYGVPLHRFREYGGAPKVLDLLDERALRPAEAAAVAALVLGEATTAGLPHPEADPAGYLRGLANGLKPLAHTYDPATRTARPWLDVKTFPGAGKGKGCAIS